MFELALESVVFLIAFSYVRTYAGGFHCQKVSNCYIMSTSIISLVLFIVRLTPETCILILSIVILCMCIPIIYNLAPVETLNKPLEEAEQRYYRKKTVVHLQSECIVISILFVLGLGNFAYVICLGIMVSALSLLLSKLINKKRRILL